LKRNSRNKITTPVTNNVLTSVRSASTNTSEDKKKGEIL